MPILQLTTDFAGQVGIQPRLVRLLSSDTYSTITAPGYVSGVSGMGVVLEPTDFVFASYDGGFGSFNPVFSGSTVTLVATPVANEPSAEVILNTSVNGQTITSPNASATPGTLRAIRGLVTDSIAVITSGNLVGVRGEADIVGASGGFVYGVQGKVIPTGTISGSVWVAGVFGQFDLSSATVTTGQLACIWGDMGVTATSGTYAGLRGIAMTNTTAAICNAQVYLYGGATNFLELVDNNGVVGATYFVAAGTSGGSAGDAAHCAASKVLKITVNGVDYWLPLFASNS